MSAQIEKIALFIDGANLYATAKSLGFDIDYKRLLREFQSRGYLVRAFYYTAVIEDQEYSSIRPLIDWLDYNGYTVVTKATKEFVDQTGRRKVKGNMDIELAVDAMEIAPLSTRWCCSPATATFARWSRRCSGAACGSSSSPPSRPSRRWWPTSCAARPTSSSTSSSCKPRSAAIRPNARCASRAKAGSRASRAIRRNSSSAAPPPSASGSKSKTNSTKNKPVRVRIT